MEKETQPKKYDLVLGGNNPPPTDGLVLGGIEGVKLRLSSDNVEVRIAALRDALKYGCEGLDLIVTALNNESLLVQDAVYDILQSCPESRIKIILEEYENTPCLRFDGIYQYFNENRLYCNIIRFYQDKTAIVASVQARDNYVPINKIIKWFDKSSDNISIGNYIIEENKIAVLTKSRVNSRTINYDGIIKRNKIVLNIFSRTKGNHSSTRKYVFVSFNKL